MSSLPPFVAGLFISGMGYFYLSRQVVEPRNRLMMEHFPSQGLVPYRPERSKISLQNLWPGSTSSSSESNTANPAPSSSRPDSPEGLHPLLVEARNSWNAAVHTGADAIISIFYGGSAKSDGSKKDESRRDSSD